MKVTITRPLVFKTPATKRTLSPGVHDLTQEEVDSWYFNGLVESGAVVIGDSTVPKTNKLDYTKHRIILGEKNQVTIVEDPIPAPIPIPIPIPAAAIIEDAKDIQTELDFETKEIPEESVLEPEKIIKRKIDRRK